MNPRKRKPKSVWIAEFNAEALRLAGNVSANQRRFLEVAVTHGKTLEPTGLLAAIWCLNSASKEHP